MTHNIFIWEEAIWGWLDEIQHETDTTNNNSQSDLYAFSSYTLVSNWSEQTAVWWIRSQWESIYCATRLIFGAGRFIIFIYFLFYWSPGFFRPEISEDLICLIHIFKPSVCSKHWTIWGWKGIIWSTGSSKSSNTSRNVLSLVIVWSNTDNYTQARRMIRIHTCANHIWHSWLL